ncbi:DUF7359 domain-containing protein, partial [Mycobacterium tuberculosis]|uniref:DUF7359 domain-containing protein n=1 Tax=Mycobacterium tuberculosis TaxID=1773 RepID=UPI001BDFF822
MYASPSTAPYHFGTDVMNEYVFEVPDVKRSLILYDVPNNLNYTFGIQAYRKVDSEIDINEIIFSPIVQSEVPIEHPY